MFKLVDVLNPFDTWGISIQNVISMRIGNQMPWKTEVSTVLTMNQVVRVACESNILSDLHVKCKNLSNPYT